MCLLSVSITDERKILSHIFGIFNDLYILFKQFRHFKRSKWNNNNNNNNDLTMKSIFTFEVSSTSKNVTKNWGLRVTLVSIQLVPPIFFLSRKLKHKIVISVLLLPSLPFFKRVSVCVWERELDKKWVRVCECTTCSSERVKKWVRIRVCVCLCVFKGES